ncbi:hypothetical protein [Clostridium tagluense]|uniref:hypothetical protein n=1 Tax=Clostridium tagluense TaxID=360422 RepID=UPI001CF0FBCD|nr:hypothetical protein [Clostridium tagluense]MCB2297776.1 hypothetical protein [Clostridium tagluense]
MGVNINDWQILLTDEQVNNNIKNYKSNFLETNETISSREINEVYNTIVSNSSLSNRAKLFYLQQFENFLIHSRIQTDEGVIAYKNSLFNK